MNSLSLPIIHPAFDKLKRAGIWMHLTAGLLILTHAFSHLHQPESAPLYIGCQVLISLDILILVFAGGNSLQQNPRVNFFFRMVEILFFLGIASMRYSGGNWIFSLIHLLLGIIYGFLLYCEQKINRGYEEYLSFHHSGLTIPGLPGSRFFIWSNINQVEVDAGFIRIETSLDQNLYFAFRKNLDSEELEQIHEFCRHYLKEGCERAVAN